MNKIVLIGFISAAVLSIAHAEEVQLASCYAETFQSRDWSEINETYYTDISYFQIEDVQPDRIRFSHKQAGGNFHLCFVNGFAKKISENTYLYVDRPDFWSSGQIESDDNNPEECKLTFLFNDDEVFVSASGNCRDYCGARAGFGGSLSVSVAPALCPEISPHQ